MVDTKKFPSEMITLPSHGHFYPEGSLLASGEVELYYLTAYHEDLLTTKSYITKGIVIDKLLEALIVNPDVNLNDLLLGDKGAIVIASRILGYGKDYPISFECPSCSKKMETVVDLQLLEDKECPYLTDEHKGNNAFVFTLPMTKKSLVFKFLTHGDERQVQAELDAMKKAVKMEVSHENTLRLRKSIVSVDGNEDPEFIKNFVESMPARDARSFREHIRKTSPDINLTTAFSCNNCEYEGRVDVPIDATFFWPESAV